MLLGIFMYSIVSNISFRVAIQDMVVRGAPAIAIAAALSLAVEVSNLQNFNGTSEEATSFIDKKLDYLVSRYIYVNLTYF